EGCAATWSTRATSGLTYVGVRSSIASPGGSWITPEPRARKSSTVRSWSTLTPSSSSSPASRCAGPSSSFWLTNVPLVDSRSSTVAVPSGDGVLPGDLTVGEHQIRLRIAADDDRAIDDDLLARVRPLDDFQINLARHRRGE